jgi:DNA primase
MADPVTPAVYPERKEPGQDLNIARTVPVSEVVGSYVSLKLVGREWVGHCPFHRDRTPSFTVVDAKGFFHCFGCGAHGDAIAFLRRMENISFPDAVSRVAESSSSTVSQRAKEKTGRRSSASRWWEKVWSESKPGTGTLVDSYLRCRGITIDSPPTVRFVPRLRHAPSGLEFPAMVAAFQDLSGSITGIHRTYLSPDGCGKADVSVSKRMAGRCWGSAIRLAAAGETLAIAEGIETGLSVMQVVPDLAVWAAGSLGNLAGAGRGDGRPHPMDPSRRLPSEDPDARRLGLVAAYGVRRVIILADADGDPHAGAALTERALRKFQLLGVTARIAWPRPGMDFNDMLQGGTEP